MKQIILLMMLLASVCLQAKQTFNATHFSVEAEEQWGTDTIMIEDDNTVIYTITLTDVDIINAVFVRWSISGDIVLANQTSTSATFYSKGPAKGRISYYYDDLPEAEHKCGVRSTFIDIYKHFDAEEKYGLTIVGPDCIADGDSVVYSIKPILTTSVNSGIGIDLYNWNIFDATSAPYVQNVSYVSGDSSSVTFKAGTMTGRDSITVRVGLANEEYRLVKHLGKAAPMPIVRDTCLPYDQLSFEVDVLNEEYPNLHYSWTWPTDWQMHKIENTYNSKVRFTAPKVGEVGDFSVTSSFTNQESVCAYASQSSFSLTRSWGRNAHIKPVDTIVANNCDFIDFQLMDAVGQNSEPKWKKPTTWKADGDSIHSTFKARPVHSTTYKDSLIVWEDVCNHRDSCVAYVYIRPAKVDSITNHGCLTVDEEYTFTVERLEVGPTPTGYIWLRGADTLQNSASNSVTFTADAAYPTLTVISKGEYNLLSERSTFNLSYNPVPPAGIVDTNSCVNYNMPDTLTFSIQNPVPNQKYAWTEPTGWTKIDSTNNNTSVTMISNGVSEHPHTIYAKGVNEDNEDCSESSSVSHNVTINAIVPIVMRIPGGNTTAYYLIIGEGTPLLTEWNIYDNNGTLVEQYSLANSGALTVNDNSVIYNDVNNSTQYTLVLYVTLTNSCKYRYVCGAQSNSNPAPSRRSNNIYKTDNRLNVKIFPNPVQSEISINIFDTDNYIADISIYDMNGSLVSQSMDFNTEEKFDVSVLPMGNYIIYIKQGEKYCANLFIKQ